MTLTSLSCCLTITKPWLWKVLPEKKKRHENQKNKNIYATRPSNFHPLLHNGPYRCKLVAITGSDNITAFFGKDKWKAVKIPQHNEGYVRAMMSIGEEWWVSEETFKIKGTETLVWQLHWSVKCPPYNTIQYNTIQHNTIQYNTIQCSLFWEGRYMINPVKSFLTHSPL